MEAGGLRTWALAKYLVEQGYEVTVVVPSWDPLTGRRLQRARRLATRVEVDGIELVHVWSSRNDRSSRFRRVGYFLTQSLSSLVVALRRPRPDVVISANYPPTLAMAAAFAAWIYRRPFVLEVRDLPAEAAVASGYLRNRLLAQVVLRLERFLFRLGCRIITVAPGMKRRMTELGVPEPTISVVPNAYEDAIFSAEEGCGRDLRREQGWEGRFVVLYAGTMGHIPDLMTLLKTAELTVDDPSIVYALIGDGQRRNDYRAFAQGRGLDNCEFLGRKPRSEIPLFCRAADVCVNLFPNHPFWGTILGNKTFDYLGSGTAYVYCGTEPSDTGNVLRASGAGLVVPPENPQRLRDALLSLRDHPGERIAMGARGRRYVMEHFSRERIDRKFEAVLNEAMDDGSTEG